MLELVSWRLPQLNLLFQEKDSISGLYCHLQQRRQPHSSKLLSSAVSGSPAQTLKHIFGREYWELLLPSDFRSIATAHMFNKCTGEPTWRSTPGEKVWLYLWEEWSPHMEIKWGLRKNGVDGPALAPHTLEHGITGF